MLQPPSCYSVKSYFDNFIFSSMGIWIAFLFRHVHCFVHHNSHVCSLCAYLTWEHRLPWFEYTFTCITKCFALHLCKYLLNHNWHYIYNTWRCVQYTVLLQCNLLVRVLHTEKGIQTISNLNIRPGVALSYHKRPDSVASPAATLTA